MNIKVYEIVQYEYADSLSRFASRLITCRWEDPLVIRYMREPYTHTYTTRWDATPDLSVGESLPTLSQLL